MKVNGQLHGFSALPLRHWLEGRVIIIVVVDVSDSYIWQKSNHGSSVVHSVAQRMCQLGTWSGVGTFTEQVQNYPSLRFIVSCKLHTLHVLSSRQIGEDKLRQNEGELYK
jgi:hypothetical protein